MSLGAKGAGPIRLAGEAPADVWRARLSSVLPAMRVEWLVKGPIDAELEVRDFGRGALVRAKDPPCHLSRSEGARPEHGFQLVWHVEGDGRYHCDGRDVEQREGDLILLDSARAVEVTHRRGAHVLVWSAPRQLISPRLRSDRAVNRPLTSHEGLGSLMAAELRALHAEVPRITAAAQRVLEMRLAGLVGLAFGPSQVGTERDAARSPELRRAQIRAFIEANFRDPKLRVDDAARALGISRRWLQALLRESEPFAAQVARRRLEEAYLTLLDPGCDSLSIAQVAFRSGFSDLSTFYRGFRRHYREPPGVVRRTRPTSR